MIHNKAHFQWTSRPARSRTRSAGVKVNQYPGYEVDTATIRTENRSYSQYKNPRKTWAVVAIERKLTDLGILHTQRIQSLLQDVDVREADQMRPLRFGSVTRFDFGVQDCYCEGYKRLIVPTRPI